MEKSLTRTRLLMSTPLDSGKRAGQRERAELRVKRAELRKKKAELKLTK